MEIDPLLKELKSFEKEKYDKIDLDRLVMYGVNLLEENGIDALFDDIVVLVFKLFPEKFALIRYPYYPDAKRVHDCLWHCTYKGKQWLKGNPKSGFKVTDKGKEFVSEAKLALEGKLQLEGKNLKEKADRKEVFFIELLEKSDAYKKFIGGNKEQISDYDIRSLLRVTRNAPKETAINNLKKYENFSKILHKTQFDAFFDFLIKKIKKIYEEKNEN